MVRLISLLLLCAPLAQAGISLESMKVSDFLHNRPLPGLVMPKGSPVSPKAPGHIREVRIYDRFGWSWESDAQNARNEAERGLRAAGMVVLSGKVYRAENSPWNYGFHLEVLADEQGYPARSIESYSNGTQYSFESEARQEAERVASNLRGAGYSIILLQIRRQEQSPWDYSYFIDYVAPRGSTGGGPAQLFTSALFNTQWDAQRDMDAMANNLRMRGYEVLSGQLFQDGRSRMFFYQLRYRGYPRR